MNKVHLATKAETLPLFRLPGAGITLSPLSRRALFSLWTSGLRLEAWAPGTPIRSDVRALSRLPS
jgi:hypothetical protein